MVIDPNAIASGLRSARDSTKADGGFYWKGKSGTYREFLTDNQIDAYYSKYDSVLSEARTRYAKT